MKILWHSQAPWVAGGYGNQTALFAPRLAKLGHDVVISAYYGLRGGALSWGDTPVWPAMADDYGNDSLGIYARAYSPDLVITLLDVFVLKTAALRQHKVAAWTPVDHDPLPPEVVDLKLRQFDIQPIAMSRFGETKLIEAGFDPLYVPHGVDTTVFQPRDRVEAKRLLGLPTSAFVVGMVAANYGNSPPRKAFPEALLAFRKFHRKHPDAVLYLHTELLGGAERIGMDIVGYMRAIGLDGEAVHAVDQHLYTLGLPQEHLSAAYSAMDVLLNPSFCEGFGIPIIEAQACGTPVIVNSFSSMPELCGAGWQADGERIWHEPHGAWFQRPNVDSITSCLERAYTGCSPKLRQQARRFALGYDADRIVTEHWQPTLEALA